MNNKKWISIVAVCLLTVTAMAQGVKILPSIHVDGKWLVDQYGNHVVLHGVMDTPSMWFNGNRWSGGYNETGAKNCMAYFEKLYTGLEAANCDVFRLHLDPAWTNDGSVNAPGFTTINNDKSTDPLGQEVSGEANIAHFSEARLKKFLEILYIPLMKMAMNHGMYVVVRPPGVCPHEIRVGGYYQKYLLTVWDIVSKDETIRSFPGQISLELANEPIEVKESSGSESNSTLRDFFQPIVDKIRENGFKGIIWVPGSGYQSNYRGYKTYPIKGDNIGYAVHDYPGWYNCSDEKVDRDGLARSKQDNLNSFLDQVPVVNSYPVIITEVDWSPLKEPKEVDHVNEMGQITYKNLGTWATASTSKWGLCFKNLLDHFGNLSMTLTHPHDYIDLDKLMLDPQHPVPAFGGTMEACSGACFEWYAEYAKVDNPKPDYVCDVPLSDQGDGTYTNPIVPADFPDPDVIRVGDTYYMITTSMFNFPGATILKSYDMVNWEYCANPLQQLSDMDGYRLANNMTAYGCGMWACSMKYNDGKFYILINERHPVQDWSLQGWLLTATDPEGTWAAKKLPRSYYDPGMLFEGDKVYVAQGIGTISVCELDKNFNFKKEQAVITGKEGLEGSHMYKKGDYYYIYATYGGWPSGQAVFRSKNPFGPYEEKMLVEKTIDGKPNTVHQGALIEDVKGNWWTIMQEDLGALGRMPNLQPVKWEDGWPVVGDNGKPYKTYTKPACTTTLPTYQMETTDVFRTFPLGKQWGWNHQPNANGYSLFVRPGWLRLNATSTTTQLAKAQNTLTQRIFAFNDKPTIGTVKLDVTRLAEGDRAGICILNDPYAQVGIEKKNGEYKLYWREDALSGDAAAVKEQYASASVTEGVVYLRASIAYSTGRTKFYYSLDNKTWTAIGLETSMAYTTRIFVGARFGLFCYATNGTLGGGSADFDWFATEEGFDEDTLYQPYTRKLDEKMFTATKLAPAATSIVMKVGTLSAPRMTATFKDRHTENVSSQVVFQSESPDVVDVYNGQLRALKQGSSVVSASYKDMMGNMVETQFTVNATYFPFSADDVKLLYGTGTYTESGHMFRPFKNGRQYGRIGWEYDKHIDISDYQYLVVKLRALTTVGNIYIYPTAENVYFKSENFSNTRQFVIDLKEAKYTSTQRKGQPLDLTDIRVICFSGDGSNTNNPSSTSAGSIYVSEMFLSNDAQYDPTGIAEVMTVVDDKVDVCTLSGLLLRRGVARDRAAEGLPAGIYVIGGKKVIIK